MSKNLLHKTQRIYFIFLALLFAIAFPLFYIMFKELYLEEIDEMLFLKKTEFKNNYISTLKINDIPNWNRFNAILKIETPLNIKHDTLYTTMLYNIDEKEYEPYRILKAPIFIENKPFTLTIQSSLLESHDFIITIALLFSAILISLFLGLWIINKKLSSRLWNPFYKTLNQIEHFELDNPKDINFSKSDIEEFNRLNLSLQKLIQRNILIHNNQREFIDNAAHELQTPIAILKAKIDTLMQLPNVTKEQSEILTSINNTITRLQRLNKNLLLLSKLDKQQFENTETLSIKTILEQQLDFFIEQASSKNITVQTDFKNDISVTANADLTEILINNLLLNSIKHNVENGQIMISISNKKLIISNTGIEQALPQDKLFNRFSKINSSKQGTGLGLAIVKKIAELNKWTVSYTYQNNHHNFSVSFL